MKELLFLIGTRPEAVKMWPVIAEAQRRGLLHRVLLSGQHPDPAPEIFGELGLMPESLGAMTAGEDLFSLFRSLLRVCGEALSRLRPAALAVHGDTATAVGGALAAFHMGIPVFHVEAGLRTYDSLSPYPEEAYRHMIASVATLHFAPTEGARRNLLSEGIRADRITVTGNTAVDAFRLSRGRGSAPPLLHGQRLCLVSLHRRESTDAVSRAVFSGVARALSHLPRLSVYCTVYPYAASRAAARELLGGHLRATLAAPTDVFTYHALLRQSACVVTDSGGVTEEALSAGVPVFITRRSTERFEGVMTGGARLLGVEDGAVFSALMDFFQNEASRSAMRGAENPYGDGNAAPRILSAVESFYEKV